MPFFARFVPVLVTARMDNFKPTFALLCAPPLVSKAGLVIFRFTVVIR